MSNTIASSDVIKLAQLLEEAESVASRIDADLSQDEPFVDDMESMIGKIYDAKHMAWKLIGYYTLHRLMDEMDG